jgi:hypothetical protein
MNQIGSDDWLPGDRERQNIVARTKPDVVLPPDEGTYDVIRIHDVDWYEKVKPKPDAYVTAIKFAYDSEEKILKWEPEVVRIRLLQKTNACRSVVVSGVDDFWIEAEQDHLFFYLSNLRNGKKLIRYKILKQDVAVIASWNLIFPKSQS